MEALIFRYTCILDSIKYVLQCTIFVKYLSGLIAVTCRYSSTCIYTLLFFQKIQEQNGEDSSEEEPDPTSHPT